jgi:hypothetical protein
VNAPTPPGSAACAIIFGFGLSDLNVEATNLEAFAIGHRLALLRSACCMLAVGALATSGCGATHTSGRQPVGQVRSRTPLLRAFSRAPSPQDAWPSAVAPLPRVRASRLIASLSSSGGRVWRLYLLQGVGETCLELAGVTGSCHTGANFFAGAPYALIEAGDLIAAVVVNQVDRVTLQTPSGLIAVPLTADRGVLVLCPLQQRARTCAHDALTGTAADGRRVFEVQL